MKPRCRKGRTTVWVIWRMASSRFIVIFDDPDERSNIKMHPGGCIRALECKLLFCNFKFPE